MKNNSRLDLLQKILLSFSLIMFVFFIVYLHFFGNLRTPLAPFDYYQRGLPMEERVKLGLYKSDTTTEDTEFTTLEEEAPAPSSEIDNTIPAGVPADTSK